MSLPTPALIINAALMRRNLQRLADYAQAHSLRIRPHTKTHKSTRLARLQLEHGCTGLTVAKAGEAEIMAAASNDLLMAYPAVDPARCQRLAQLAGAITMRVAIDTREAGAALSQAAAAAGSTIGILVDLDVGMGRTGVQTPADALALAQLVSKHPGLRLDGLMIYPGHIKSPAEQQIPTLRAIDAVVAETLNLFARSGLQTSIVSGGSTPSAYQSHHVTHLTEIRPGTYIFNDANTLRGGFCTLDDCAARITATVVSDAVPGQFILDAGSKTLTTDPSIQPATGHGLIVEYPDAVISRLSEEHAQVDARALASRPKVGERVTIIPNHICPCINLQDRVWLEHEDGALEALEVEARGRLS